jgi:hypothetical protein
MRKDLLSKTLVMGVVVLFIGACLLPSINGKQYDLPVDEEFPVDSSMVSDSATLSFHTFDKTGEKQKDVVIPADAAHEINDMLEELKHKITYESLSDETRALKIEFVDLLDVYGLIPEGLSKSYVLSLLNPSWLNNKQKTLPVKPMFPIIRNFVSRILGVFANLQQFFKMRFGNDVPYGFDENILPSLPYNDTGTATFCSMGSGGNGSTLPFFLLPRPRCIAMWSSTEGVTATAGLLTGKGFIAEGAQTGLALGFVGLGLSVAIPGYRFYGFIGYALFTSVSADNIEFFPPNQVPMISDENPPNGAVDVPLTLSELSFRIKDGDRELMSYTVTTEPDIGSGSDILKPDGVYSVPISGLEYDKQYKWTVEVSDGKETTVKQFSFFTVVGPPFDPFDEGWQYRKGITIDHKQVDGDLTSFPVLISITDGDLRDKAQSDGDDILFMDGPDAANRLYHEIEYFDGGSGELVAWVNIPLLFSGMDTDLYIYYDNPSCSNQQFPEKVWYNNYIMVQHMYNYAGITYDSTIYDNDGLIHEAIETTGISSNALEFSGSSNSYVDCGDNQVLNLVNAMTISVWVNPDVQKLQDIVFRSTSHPYNGYTLELQETSISLVSYLGMSQGKALYTIPVDTWSHIAVSRPNNGEYKIYVNGVDVTSWSSTNSPASADTPLYIGSSHNTRGWEGRDFDGIIDEVRISSIEFSSSWITTSYNTINDPSSFFDIGPEESAP